MKRARFLPIAAGLVLAAASAQAISLPNGNLKAHFTDYSSIYTANGVAMQAGYTPAAGDYLKSFINMEQVLPAGGGSAVWNSSATDQVAGFEYNFVFLGLVGVVGSGSEKTYWGAPSGDNSKVDLYARNPNVFNTAAGLAPQTGPDSIDLNNAPNIVGVIPGINDGGATLWASMNVLLHPDQTFVGTTLVMTGNINTGTGSGDLYADVVAGSIAPYVALGTPGPLPVPADMYLKFSYNLNDPRFGFTVRSEDPANFTIVPEPGTMILLGSGLMGLAGIARRKTKKS